jgi:hypothetical protein
MSGRTCWYTLELRVGSEADLVHSRLRFYYGKIREPLVIGMELLFSFSAPF